MATLDNPILGGPVFCRTDLLSDACGASSGRLPFYRRLLVGLGGDRSVVLVFETGS